MKLSRINTGGENKHLGDEPSWTEQSEMANLKIEEIRALNWYNYFCDSKQAKTFLVEYMSSVGRPKDEISLVASGDSAIPNQLGWVARMMCNGYEPSTSFKTFFVREFKTVLLKTKKVKQNKVAEVTVASVPVVSIQDRIRDKASEEIGEVEGLIDDYILSECKSNIDLQSYFKSRNLSAVVLKRMCEFFIVRSKEFDDVMNTTDPFIKEAYSNFSKVELRRLREFINAIVTETNRVAVENKPTRKTRKTKQKPAAVVAAKVQYLKEYSDLGLKSILPEKIIGSQQVWLYNTKTKLLGMYNADNAKGLTIKGTTIQNINVESSSGKRLRKPEVVIKDVLAGGKITLKKLLDSLSTKPVELTGRINSDTIIVRVIN